MKKIFFIMIVINIALWANFSRNNVTKIVTDSTRSLQWQDDVNISKTWIEAIDYCEALTLGGYSDWRLPNFNELYYIADRSKAYPVINSVFHNVTPRFYWSSMSVAEKASSAWVIDFYYGGDYWNSKSLSGNVRCVRIGQ